MTRKSLLIGLAILAASLLATAVLYPSLPAQVPTHWNARGQIDGYSPKWSLFVAGPGILAALLGMFAALPWLSPRHFTVDTFRSTYLYIMVVTLAIFAYFQALLLWAARAGHVDISKAIWGGICLLFVLLGNVMGKVRRNFYIGIRTPWTLANERVWSATHRFGGRTMVLGGLAGLALSFAGTAFWVPLAALMAGVFAPVVYSLVYYKQLEHRGQI
jgi:uncharacterized membrane protein